MARPMVEARRMQDRLGKFQILRQLGQGAMGEVFLAQDTVLGREVAIKTIMAGSAFGEEARSRFEREARVTGVLNHPHIVTVYEFGQSDNFNYLVMEYVEGENLEVLIQKQSLPKARLLELIAQVCEGLAFAHDHGVIHRDIKPANVQVGIRGKRMQAKLMDFGVATVDASNLTQQGIWMGTVNYMAPEYLDTGKATASSDLFAIGVMLYEVVTGGRKPFSGETTTIVLNAILREAPAAFVPEDIKDVSPEVLAVVRKALAKAPSERYASAEDLGDALREVLPTLGAPSEVRDSGPHARPAVLSREVKEPSDRILVVGRGGKANCLSIRVALRQAEEGNLILIQPGHYRESLVLDRAVTLRGEGELGAVVIEATRGPALTVKGAKVVVEGLAFQGEAGVKPEGEAVVRVQEGHLNMEGCRITTAAAPGLHASGKGTVLHLSKVHAEGEAELGFCFDLGATAQLDQCTLRGFQRAALMAHDAGQVTLHQVRMEGGLGAGLWALGCSQVTLEDCDFLDREAGSLEAEGDARITLRRGRYLGSRCAGWLLLAKAQVVAEDAEVGGHMASGIHVEGGATLLAKHLRIMGNGGYGLSVLEGSSAALDGCELSQNQAPGVLIHTGGMVQMKGCKLFEGHSLGVVCATGGKGVLEACEVFGNAQSGAQVEPGGSLLLVRCTLRDGRDTGLLLFEDAEVTLEECVVHRNARGGILLAKDASDPVIRGANGIEDDLYRANAQGNLVKLAPLKKR